VGAYPLAILIFFVLFFIIGVAISRWIFRVNDIVRNLEQINAKLSAIPEDSDRDKPLPINLDAPCSKCGYKPMKIITRYDGARGIECPMCRSFYPE